MKYLILALGLLQASLCGAQVVQQASPEQLIEKLTPPAPVTRSLRNLTPKPVTVDLSIQFDFDSANLQAASKPLLDNLALAMNSERLSALHFLVEGHTDAKGKTDYNLQLSNRRAHAVVDYLTQVQVSPLRLQAQGKGATELLIPERPLASENRRVRITVQP